jgi:hypothetical protein
MLLSLKRGHGMTGLDCIVALKALGEETRLRILRLLFKEPLSVNEKSQVAANNNILDLGCCTFRLDKLPK